MIKIVIAWVISLLAGITPLTIVWGLVIKAHALELTPLQELIAITLGVMISLPAALIGIILFTLFAAFFYKMWGRKYGL